MKVRAQAVMAEESNAIGALELECTPFGLVIVYLGVGSFAEGYATAARTSHTEVMVPWAALEQVRLEGKRLFLAFDKTVSPHHRLTLSRFELGDRTHRSEIPRRRLVLATGVLGATVVAALVSMVFMPKIAPDRAASATLLVAFVFAAALLVLGFLADQRILAGGEDTESVREMFVAELASHYGGLVRSNPPPKRRARRPLNLQGFLPRTTAAIVITLSASTLAAVLMGRWMLANERSPKEVARVAPSRRSAAADRLPEEVAAPDSAYAAPQALAQPSEPGPATAPEGPGAGAEAARPDEQASLGEGTAPLAAGAARVLGGCSCARGDSALWRDPIPKLSILLLSSKLRLKGTRKLSELEVAIVNNSDKSLDEITLNVDFFERDPSPAGRRHLISHRPLYYEGPLLPGKAIKWSVEAEGEEFEIENPIPGDIGPGGDGAAPLSQFAELLSAVHRPVRLHGAMMLAYFGDPRAREATLGLREALREDESPYLNRVLQALADVRVCALAVAPEGGRRKLGACVFNSTDAPRDRVALRVRALAAEISHRRPVARPPELLAEATWSIPGALEPGRGVRVEALFDLGLADASRAKAFEALADREDLLP